MRTNPNELKRRIMRTHNTVLISRISSWDNLTKEQIEAFNQILDVLDKEKRSNKIRFI